MTFEEFIAQAWAGYVRLAPDAPRIYQILLDRGEKIVNDHVALRTFNLPPFSRVDLGRFFLEWGYERGEDLEIPEKKVAATYYVDPDGRRPTIFLSELLVGRCSETLGKFLSDLCQRNSGRAAALGARVMLERAWDAISVEEYREVYEESEYAAWTVAFGIRVNHFTVLVNALRTVQGLEELNALIQQNGIALNGAGGLIKGSPHDLLEQSSTMAALVPWEFSGGRTEQIPGCYCEFARRHVIPGTDRLFQGFVPESANKIFESTSTNAKKACP